MGLPRLIGFLAILATAAPVALAETYKWVDDKGVVNYSNKPPPAQAAKQKVVEERLSVVASDPALGQAISAMNARAARRAEYEEADWARRQSLLLASQASYVGAGADCPYRANCDRFYDLPAYYYPYAYGGTVFNAVAGRRPPHVAHHDRPHVSPRGTGGMPGRGSRQAGRGSFR
jgi:Domain of unknown function (DUF4124)